MNRPLSMETDLKNQSGGGMLSIVALLGGVIMLVQGSVYYRAKTSAAFLGTEKGKVLAMQMAEAGIEENIADIGTRKLKVREGMQDTVTYYKHSLGSGKFTSTLRPVAMGADADTVDVTSSGSMGKGFYSVQARLRLRNFLDTILKIDTTSTLDTVITQVPETIHDTTYVTTTRDPSTMPALNATPAYDACMASSDKKCDVCHIPLGNPANMHVIDINKNSIHTHISHHGDYVTTDGTCDLYAPQTNQVITTSTVLVPFITVTNPTAFDTTLTVDTLVRVQVLSWK